MLGKYELRELLGEGGMGAVYRAYDHNLKREVAVKVINLTKNDTELRARFIREAETAANLEHSHIVRIYDYGVERDINYIVMQNLTGGALSERMKQAAEAGRLRASLPEVALLLEQLASALDYAHTQGVIHRDIKPQNVMFSNQGQAFIVDFGIAKLLTGATNMTGIGTAMGTPSYMSPEQWATDGIVPASDQYALAVMTYQLIAGRLPFEADTPMRVMYRHLNDQPTPLSTFRSDIPASLLLVMDRALAKDPNHRFPNCTQFAQAFSSAVIGVVANKTEFFTFKLATGRPAGAPITPTPNLIANTPSTPASNSSLPASPLTQQPASKSSRNMLIGGVGGLAVLGILAVLLFGNRSPSEAELRLTDVGQTLVAVGLATESIETREAGLELIATATPEPTETSTETPEPTTTNTATEAPTETDTATATKTASPSATATASPTETNTSTFTPSLSPREAALSTLDMGATQTATLWTSTPSVTFTPTEDYQATVFAELTAMHFEGLTATATLWTATPSATQTLTQPPTLTPTFTFTSTPSLTKTAIPSATLTFTPTFTQSPTMIPSHTSTSTATITPTLEPTLTIGEALSQGKFRVIQAESCDFSISLDSVYLAVGGDGVYRLADSLKLFSVSGSYGPVFSPDSAFVAVIDDGVYDISNNRKLFDISGSPKFSPDSRYVAVSNDGIYRLADSQKLFEISTYNNSFSADSDYIGVSEDGIYRLADGTKLFSISGSYNNPEFSPDSAYVAIREDGIYRLADGTKLFSNLRYYSSVFSPDSAYVAISEDGIYRLADGQKVFEISTYGTTFSPDSAYVAVSKDGIYRVADGQKMFEISGDYSVFSPDGVYVAVSKDGIYRVADGQKMFEISGDYSVFSPDGVYVAVSEDGVYRLGDGQKLFEILGYYARFSDDSAYIIIDKDGMYRLTDGERILGRVGRFASNTFIFACNVVVPSTEIVTLQALTISGANLRENPSANAAVMSSVPSNTRLSLVGKTNEGYWYLTSDFLWISNNVVNVQGDIGALSVVGN